MTASTELFAEPPDAERDQRECEEEQGQEVWPDRHESAAFEHGSADDGGEVVDRVEHGERLQPFRHRLDGVERAGERGHRRIDEEAGELCLLRGFGEGRDDGADADAGEDAEAASDEQQADTAVEGNFEHEADDGYGDEHHEGEQEEERRDFGDDDFRGAGGGHEELLDGSGFALTGHGGGGDQGTVEDEQQAEDAGDDEPGIDQAWVEEEVGLELDLAAAGIVGACGGLDVDVDSLLRQAGVVALDDAEGVGAADGGGVGVGGVEEELDSGGALASEVAGVVVGDNDSGVGVATADGVTKLADGGVVAGKAKALALGEGGDEFAALGRAAVVDHGEANVGDGGAEREAEERELQDGRKDQ